MKRINTISNSCDKLYLGEDAVFPADPSITGLNSNVVVVGGTGTGKTVSCVLPLLLHNRNTSMVIPITKKKIIYETYDILEANGYKVKIIDFSKNASTIGFNPLMYLKDDNDIANMSHTLIGQQLHEDKYWEDVSSDVISSLIYLSLYIAKEECNTQPDLSHFMVNYNMYRRGYQQRGFFDDDDVKHRPDISTLNKWFEKLEEVKGPDNYGSLCWSSISHKAERTFSNIKSVTNVAVSKITKNIIELSKMPETIDFEALGKEKTALFVLTSPFDRKVSEYVNLFYSMLLERLMRAAENNPNERLDIPVQIIFDDFACGTKIEDFDKYISIFRAAGISVVLLLQSESQLEGMYGKAGGVTILNNCDTYVYMGGTDTRTCREVAVRCNMNLNSILNMDLHRVIVFRRGIEPIFTMRYPTYEDEIFKSVERSA